MSITGNPSILEKFSKTGRPKRFSYDEEVVYETLGLFAEVKTERSRLNVMYRQRVIYVLSQTESPMDFEWLFDLKCADPTRTDGKKGNFRKTILVELGKIDDDATLVHLASVLCEAKPKTSAAIQQIRRWRGTQRPRDNYESLHDGLRSFINEYLSKYRSTTWDEVWDALDGIRDAVEVSMQQDKQG